MTEPVPLLDLQAQYAPLREEFLAAIARVCDSQRCILGAEVDALERELAALPRRRRTPIGVSSGTDALLAGADGARRRPRRRGDHAAFSFFATAGCVARLGAQPRVRRHRPDDLQPRHRRRCGAAITPRTKAIMPVHLLRPVRRHGRRCWPLAAGRHRRHRGRRAGHRRHATASAGRRARRLAGCFSFFPTQEPRRVRRRRPRHHQRRRARGRLRAAPRPRHGAEVLPPAHRRQLPARRAPGRGAAGEAAAPGGLDRRAPRQRRPLPRALRGGAACSSGVALPVDAPARTTSTTSS